MTAYDFVWALPDPAEEAPGEAGVEDEAVLGAEVLEGDGSWFNAALLLPQATSSRATGSPIKARFTSTFNVGGKTSLRS